MDVKEEKELQIVESIEHGAWSMGKDNSHMPAASLGHNAALSVVVIGGG